MYKMRKRLLALTLTALTLSAWAANTKTKVTQVTSTVTLSTNVDYMVSSATPFGTEGVVDITNTDHAVLILESVKPSAALSLLGSHVRINGQVARNGTNCQVKMYAQQGCMIYPYASTMKPLTVYSEQNFQGESSDNFGLENSGGFMNTMNDAKLNNRVRSFRLKRGYMVTFSTLPGGYGYQRCFIAQDADIEMAELPAVLDGTISSYRVFKWNTAGKAGLANDTGSGSCSALNVISCYSFGLGEDRGIDTECVPHHIYENWPSASACGGVSYSPHMKTNNEPRNPSDDHQQTLAEILANWQSLMRTGMRLCSPSSWDGSDYTNGTGFLKTFFDSIDARGWRCDIIDLHCYWPEGNFNSLGNWVNSVHRPIWISEWVWGASWNSNGAFASGVTEAQNAAAVQRICNNLNGMDYVERYYYWNSERDPSKLYKNGALTAAGQFYSTMKTGVGYNGKYDYVPKAPTMVAPGDSKTTWTGGNATTTWHDYNGEYNRLMEIQRKVRGQQWETIDAIAIKEEAADYKYVDQNAPVGAMYRVHIIDMNGQEYYTNEDMVPGDAVQCADGKTRYVGGNQIVNGDFQMGMTGWTNGAGTALGQPWFEVVPRGNTGRMTLLALGNKGQTDVGSIRTFFPIEPNQNYYFHMAVRNAGAYVKVDLTNADNSEEKNVVTLKNSTTWTRQGYEFNSGQYTQAILSFRWLAAKGEMGDIELYRLFDTRDEAVADGMTQLKQKAQAIKQYNTARPALNTELDQQLALISGLDDAALVTGENAVSTMRQALACQQQTDSLLQVVNTVRHLQFDGQQELADAISAANSATTAQDIIDANAGLREAFDNFMPMTDGDTQPQSPSFATATGWETVVGTYTGGDQRTATQAGKTCWNAWWSNVSATVGDKRTMEIRQQISGLPSGIYELQCKASTQHYCLSDQHGYMVVMGDTIQTPQLQADYMDVPGVADIWQTLTTRPVFVPQDSSITIGFVGSKVGAIDNAWREVGNASSTGDKREGWWCATDFRLLYHPLYTFPATPGQYSTICLPYAFTLPEGLKVYRIAGLMADYKKLALEEVTETEAGMPYICVCDSSTAVYYTGGKSVKNPITTGTNNLRGYFKVSATNTAAIGTYTMVDGVWERVVGQRAPLNSYTAIIRKAEGIPVLDTWEGVKMDIHGVTDELGEPAGIDDVTAGGGTVKATYNLGGRRTQQQRGLNIDLMEDGSARKVVVK